MPRPPIQHHKHIISLAPETLEALEGLQETFIQGKALRAAGEAAKGILSNPALGPLIVGAILSAIVAVKGKDVIDSITRWYKGIQGVLDAKTPEEKEAAVGELAGGLRDLIRFFSPLGALTPLP